MTPEELRELADKKEDEQLTPDKQGILKDNLYMNYELDPNGKITIPYVVDEQELEELINNIRNKYELALEKGTRFVGFTDEDGDCEWIDDVGYGMDLTNEGAQQYLDNISDIGDE